MLTIDLYLDFFKVSTHGSSFSSFDLEQAGSTRPGPFDRVRAGWLRRGLQVVQPAAEKKIHHPDGLHYAAVQELPAQELPKAAIGRKLGAAPGDGAQIGQRAQHR
jgi:hypothetical protein